MKRVIASILMIVMLVLFLVPAAYAKLDEPPYVKSISLWNADENWRSTVIFELDTQNQIEGEACVSTDLNGRSGVVREYTIFDPIDATDMRALEFDMYVSDLALLDHLLPVQYGYLAIGSGTRISPATKRYEFEKIVIQTQNTCPCKDGWNHVIIFLEDMPEKDGINGPFDISGVNFLEIFFTLDDCGQDWALKFDNFVLTDRQDPPTPHTPGAWQYDADKHWRHCKSCSLRIDERQHSPYDSSGKGLCEQVFTCYDCKQVCGPFTHEFTLKHPDMNSLVSYSTCTSGEIHYYKCARCGENGEDTYAISSPLGHKQSQTYLPCSPEGHALKCERCDELLSEMNPHELSDWKTPHSSGNIWKMRQYRGCKWCSYAQTRGVLARVWSAVSIFRLAGWGAGNLVGIACLVIWAIRKKQK